MIDLPEDNSADLVPVPLTGSSMGYCEVLEAIMSINGVTFVDGRWKILVVGILMPYGASHVVLLRQQPLCSFQITERVIHRSLVSLIPVGQVKVQNNWRVILYRPLTTWVAVDFPGNLRMWLG